MAQKSDKGSSRNSVRVGNISGVSGEVNIAGRDITKNQSTSGLGAAEVKQLFDQLYAAIEARPATTAANKDDLKAEVQEIQTTVTQAAQSNEKVDESFLARHFRNIARMAPDILDVAVATLANPLAGLGVAAKKIADKAKAEASAT